MSRLFRIIEKKYNTGRVEYVIQHQSSFFGIIKWWADAIDPIYYHDKTIDGKPILIYCVSPVYKTLKEAQKHLPHYEEWCDENREYVISKIICDREGSHEH